MRIKASQEEGSAMQFTAIKAVKQARIGVFSIACIKDRFFFSRMMLLSFAVSIIGFSSLATSSEMSMSKQVEGEDQVRAREIGFGQRGGG